MTRACCRGDGVRQILTILAAPLEHGEDLKHFN